MSAFESLLSVYETVRGQHNHGACSHLITQFLCRFQEKSTVKSEQEKQKDVLIAERDTAQFDLKIAQAHSQALATQVDAARARTGAAEAHIQAMSEEKGGMLAKAHAMEREKVELEKALAIAKSDIKYVRVSQRKDISRATRSGSWSTRRCAVYREGHHRRGQVAAGARQLALGGRGSLSVAADSRQGRAPRVGGARCDFGR